VTLIIQKIYIGMTNIRGKSCILINTMLSRQKADYGICMKDDEKRKHRIYISSFRRHFFCKISAIVIIVSFLFNQVCFSRDMFHNVSTGIDYLAPQLALDAESKTALLQARLLFESMEAGALKESEEITIDALNKWLNDHPDIKELKDVKIMPWGNEIYILADNRYLIRYYKPGHDENGFIKLGEQKTNTLISYEQVSEHAVRQVFRTSLAIPVPNRNSSLDDVFMHIASKAGFQDGDINIDRKRLASLSQTQAEAALTQRAFCELYEDGTLLIDPEFDMDYEQIQSSKIGLPCEFPDGITRWINLADSIAYRIAMHEFELKGRTGKGHGSPHKDGWKKVKLNKNEETANCVGRRYSLVDDAMFLWYRHSYKLNDNVRYDDTLFRQRLEWMFRDDQGSANERAYARQERNLVPNLRDDASAREKAIEIAIFINKKFFSERRDEGTDTRPAYESASLPAVPSPDEQYRGKGDWVRSTLVATELPRAPGDDKVLVIGNAHIDLNEETGAWVSVDISNAEQIEGKRFLPAFYEHFSTMIVLGKRVTDDGRVKFFDRRGNRATILKDITRKGDEVIIILRGEEFFVYDIGRNLLNRGDFLTLTEEKEKRRQSNGAGTSRSPVTVYAGDDMRMVQDPETKRWSRVGGKLYQESNVYNRQRFFNDLYGRHDHLIFEDVIVSDSGGVYLGKKPDGTRVRPIANRPELGGMVLTIEINGTGTRVFNKDGLELNEKVLLTHRDNEIELFGNATMEPEESTGLYKLNETADTVHISTKIFGRKFYTQFSQIVVRGKRVYSKGVQITNKDGNLVTIFRDKDRIGDLVDVEIRGDDFYVYDSEGRRLNQGKLEVREADKDLVIHKNGRMVFDEPDGVWKPQGGEVIGGASRIPNRLFEECESAVIEYMPIPKGGKYVYITKDGQSRRLDVRGLKLNTPLISVEVVGNEYTIFSTEGKRLRTSVIKDTVREFTIYGNDHMVFDPSAGRWRRKGGNGVKVHEKQHVIFTKFIEEYQSMVIENFGVPDSGMMSLGKRNGRQLSIHRPDWAHETLSVERTQEGCFFFTEDGLFKGSFLFDKQGTQDSRIVRLLRGRVLEEIVLRIYRTIYPNVEFEKEFLVNPLTQEYRYPDYFVPNTIVADSKWGLDGQGIVDTVLKYTRLRRMRADQDEFRDMQARPLKIVVYDTSLKTTLEEALKKTDCVSGEDYEIISIIDLMKSGQPDETSIRAFETLVKYSDIQEKLSGLHTELSSGKAARSIKGVALTDDITWRTGIYELITKKKDTFLESISLLHTNHSLYWEWNYQLRLVTFLAYIYEYSSLTGEDDAVRVRRKIAQIYPAITKINWKDLILYRKYLRLEQEELHKEIVDETEREHLIQEGMFASESKLWGWSGIRVEEFNLENIAKLIKKKIGVLKWRLGNKGIELPEITTLDWEKDTGVLLRKLQPAETHVRERYDGFPEESLLNTIDHHSHPAESLEYLTSYVRKMPAIAEWEETSRIRLMNAVMMKFIRYFTHESRYSEYPEFEIFKGNYVVPKLSEVTSALEMRGHRRFYRYSGKPYTGMQVATDLNTLASLLKLEGTNITYGDICIDEEHADFIGLDHQIEEAFQEMRTAIGKDGDEFLTEEEADQGIQEITGLQADRLASIRSHIKDFLVPQMQHLKLGEEQTLPRVYFVHTERIFHLWEVNGKFAAAHFSRKHNAIYINSNFMEVIFNAITIFKGENPIHIDEILQTYVLNLLATHEALHLWGFTHEEALSAAGENETFAVVMHILDRLFSFAKPENPIVHFLDAAAAQDQVKDLKKVISFSRLIIILRLLVAQVREYGDVSLIAPVKMVHIPKALIDPSDRLPENRIVPQVISLKNAVLSLLEEMDELGIPYRIVDSSIMERKCDGRYEQFVLESADAGVQLYRAYLAARSAGDTVRCERIARNCGRLLARLHNLKVYAGDTSSLQFVVDSDDNVVRVDLPEVRSFDSDLLRQLIDTHGFEHEDLEHIYVFDDMNYFSELMLDDIQSVALLLKDPQTGLEPVQVLSTAEFQAPFLEAYETHILELHPAVERYIRSTRAFLEIPEGISGTNVTGPGTPDWTDKGTDIRNDAISFMEKTEAALGNMIGEGKPLIFGRIPAEALQALEGLGVANERVKEFIEKLGNAPNITLEFFRGEPGSGVDTEVLYGKYNVPRKTFTDDPSVINTFTLFFVTNRDGIADMSTLTAKMGGNPMCAPGKSIVVPVGLEEGQPDLSGLARGIFQAFRLMEIARTLARGDEAKDLITMMLAHMEQLAGPGAPFNLTHGDIKRLTTGNPGTLINILNRWIRLLPIRQIDPDELRVLYERARDILEAA